MFVRRFVRYLGGDELFLDATTNDDVLDLSIQSFEGSFEGSFDTSVARSSSLGLSIQSFEGSLDTSVARSSSSTRSHVTSRIETRARWTAIQPRTYACSRVSRRT